MIPSTPRRPSQSTTGEDDDNSNTSNKWFYIDCVTLRLFSFEVLGAIDIAANGYQGGVYSPHQDRIYLIPHAQATYRYWHLIDCESGRLMAYEHGSTTSVVQAYFGGVYMPHTDRIYMVPFRQARREFWHYIDCRSGRVVEYRHGLRHVNECVNGLSVGERVYFVPNGASMNDIVRVETMPHAKTTVRRLGELIGRDEGEDDDDLDLDIGVAMGFGYGSHRKRHSIAAETFDGHVYLYPMFN